MELILRHRHHSHTDSGIDLKETQLDLSGDHSEAAALLAVALAGGVYISAYDIARLAVQVSPSVAIAASAFTQPGPVRRRIDFDALASQRRAFFEDPPLSGETVREVTGEDILALVEANGGAAILQRDAVTGVIGSITASFTEYDPAEMLEVLESLQATGTPTPTKLVGDLAQTTIVNGANQEQVLCLAEWSLSWKRKMVEATSTDDALYESSLGSSKSWTAKSKYMFLQGDQSQVDGITSAISTTALGALIWTFIPQVGLGLTAFQGSAFIDGIDIASGTGKIVGLDVSLKGTGPLTLKTQIAPITNANTITGITGQV